MLRRDISKLLLAGSVGASVAPEWAQAQTCNAPCYIRTPAEIAAGILPVDTTWPPGDVRRYGAVGDGSTGSAPKNTTAFANARAVAAASSAPFRVIFPSGIYYYSASPNWAINNIVLEAVGYVQLAYLGNADAWSFDGGTSHVYNCRMIGDFVIVGVGVPQQSPLPPLLPQAKNGLYIANVHQSQFQARVANVNEAGCDINFSVGSSFQVQTTVNASPTNSYTVKPVRGYYIKGNPNNAAEYTAWCQFHQTVIDRCSGFGVDIVGARGCSFFGGYIEFSLGGIRVDQSSDPTNPNSNNSFYSIDMERNDTYDAVIYGQHNRLIGCTTFSGLPSNSNLIIGAGAIGTQIIGGHLKSCELQATSDLSLFLNVSFGNSASNLRGPGGYRLLGGYLVDDQGRYPPAPGVQGWMPDVLGPVSLPTSPSGLLPGSLWNSGGFVKVV